MPPKDAIQWGSWHESPLKSRDFYSKHGVRTQNMAREAGYSEKSPFPKDPQFPISMKASQGAALGLGSSRPCMEWKTAANSKSNTVATEIKVKLIPRKYSFAFAFVMILIGADDLSHSCSYKHFTPNFTFAFAFVILKVIYSEIILFRFAFISVSMVWGKMEN